MPSLTTTQSYQATTRASPTKRRSGSPTGTLKNDPHATRSSQAGGVGLLLLLLAGLPFDGDGRNGAPAEQADCPRTFPTLASTANLRFCASLDDVMRAGRRLLDFSADEQDEEDDENSEEYEELTDEERRRRRKARKNAKNAKQQLQMQQASSQNKGMTYTSGDDLSSSQFTDEVQTGSFRSSVSSTSSTTANVQEDQELVEAACAMLTDLGEECLSFAMGFLSLKDVTLCRSVSKAFKAAAARDVPTPFAGSIFLRFGETCRGAQYATAPQRHLLKWNCSYCTAQNNVNYNVCRQCGGGNADCQGVRKVFLGQLRKERTTELADWLLSRLFPEMQPMHIENHTGKDNRGKGCAWIYVTSAQDEAKVLSLNKRMFVDVDDNGQEGVWFCDPTHIEELSNMSTDRAYKAKRPQVLPRQPVTAEKPGAKPQPPSKGNYASRSWGAQSTSQQQQQSAKSQQQKASNPSATAQELYEQYAAPSTSTGAKPTTSTASTSGKPTVFTAPVPRSRQKQQQHSTAATFGPHSAAASPLGRFSPTPQYQYQANDISVYSMTGSNSSSFAHQQQAPRSKLLSSGGSSGSTTGGSSSSWSHNPYGASVLSNEFYSSATAHHYQAYYPAYDQQHYNGAPFGEVSDME